MFSFFINPLMLLGLAGIALPVIAHLLSRRRYDVVEWAAMQFLNPSRKTRRKMRLEELLLLLVRVLMISLVAIAAARPWVNSGFLTGYRSGGSRDIVLVIDGSNSMSRNDGLTSLHQKAIRRAKEILESLKSGDTATVIDARDLPVPIIRSPLQDMQIVSDQLDKIPPPAGAANLRQACEEAIGLLGRSSNGTREVIVLTDRQRAGWSPGEDTSWARFDDVLKFPAVRPNVWVMDLSEGLSSLSQNLAIGRLNVSRDLSVPGFPVQLQAQIQNAGESETTVPIQISVNGQRLSSLDSTATIPANGEMTFSRELQLTATGTNLVTVKLKSPDDSLPVDNEAHAAIYVKPAIPALLVESSTRLQRSKWNTFFAELALTAPGNATPWVHAKTVRADEVTAADFEDVSVAILPDVTSLPEGIPGLLRQFVSRGNGVLISLGTNSTVDSFRQLYADSGLLPSIELQRIRAANPDEPVPTTIAPFSLDTAWLNRFRERKGASFLQAEFRKWWLTTFTQTQPQIDDSALGRDQQSPPATLAQLSTGDPFIIQNRLGDGSVILLTSNLDASWNSLPTTPDYVPFLHEAIFQMAASRTRRNVEFGQALSTTLAKSAEPVGTEHLEFVTPAETSEQAAVRDLTNDQIASLATTRLPGVYRLQQTASTKNEAVDLFVVNYDHAEDDPQELSGNDRTRLAGTGRMTFVRDLETLQKEMYGDESRSELWAILLWLFLALLMLEVWMTRRLVQRGHADTIPQPATSV